MVEILYLLSENQPNDGDATLALNRLTLVEDDELVFVTHGAILVRASDDNSGYFLLFILQYRDLLSLSDFELLLAYMNPLNDKLYYG